MSNKVKPAERIFFAIFGGILLLSFSLFNNSKVFADTDTPTPTPSQTPIPTDYALQFQPSGTSQIVLMPARTELNFGTDMTIEFWARTTSNYGGSNWYDAKWILDKDVPGSGTPDWAVALRYGKIVLSGNGSPVYSTSTINDGGWHHVAITRNFASRQIVIYLDGAQDASQSFGTLPNVSNTERLIVGSENGVGGPLAHAYPGDLDELRLWNVVRSQSEIQANMFVPLNGNEPGLVGYWRFDEGSGQIAHDTTANQLDGTLGNSTETTTGDPTWILGSLPTPTPTSTSTSTPTLTPTSTPTFTPTATSTNTPIPTPTVINTPMATPTPSGGTCTVGAHCYAYGGIYGSSYKGAWAKIEMADPQVRDGGFSAETLWVLNYPRWVEVGWTKEAPPGKPWGTYLYYAYYDGTNYYPTYLEATSSTNTYEISYSGGNSWNIYINGALRGTVDAGFSTATAINAGGEVTSNVNAMGVAGTLLLQYKDTSNNWAYWSNTQLTWYTPYIVEKINGSDYDLQNYGNN